MNGMQAFRQLGFAAKFDYKRFNTDAHRMQIFGLNNESSKSSCASISNTVLDNALDTRLLEYERPQIDTHQAEVRNKHVVNLRRKNKIYVSGHDIPEVCPSFEEIYQRCDIPIEIQNNIFSSNFSTPTPVQMQVIPLMVQRREILASAPTGSGKTLAFVVPVLSTLGNSQRNGFRAIILSPTRELVRQTYAEFLRINQNYGLRIFMLEKCTPKIIKRFSIGSKKKFDILLTTPNRLVHLFSQEPPCLNLKLLEWLVVDEADKLFESGKRGFRDQLAYIYKSCSNAPKLRHAFFSATFSYQVERWCKANLDNVCVLCVGQRNTTVETVKQELLFVGDDNGKLVALKSMIHSGHLKPPVLIFVDSKKQAKHLFSELTSKNIRVDVIHSERSLNHRANIVRLFRQGIIWVLICTELMGRGIDFKGVNLVINYDFPQTSISYIHRIGRTGRAGRQGHAISFFMESDAPLLRSIANLMRQAGCDVPSYMLKIKRHRKPNNELPKLNENIHRKRRRVDL